MKMRFGVLETAVSIYLLGLMFFIIMILMTMPLIYIVILFMGIIFTLSGLIYACYAVARNKLRPLIDKCKPNETVWFRFTKDRLFYPQIVPKGPYGQTKGVINGVPADVVDDGDFSVRAINGNPGIIMYDMMNTAVDLKKSVGRKQMAKKYKIRNGIEGYQKAKEQGEVMFPHERKGEK
jgi:hypothetical protein